MYIDSPRGANNIACALSYITHIYVEKCDIEAQMARDADRAKFVKLASARVSKALKDIQLIGNLSNRSNYDYTDDDVNKIFKALQDEISACKRQFDNAKKKKSKAIFVLD